MASSTCGINGDLTALSIDRAIGELRRGRAIRIADGDRSVVLAAVETLQTSVLARLQAVAAEGLMLLVTSERAQALGVAAKEGEAAMSLPARLDIDSLRSLAGISSGEPPDVRTCRPLVWHGTPAMASAAIRLAKAGRLLPALIAAPAAMPTDGTTVTIEAQQIEHHAAFVSHRLKLASRSRVPLADAEDCEIALYRDEHALGEHVAVIIGKPDARKPVPVRLHSACLTGDLLASLRCDCGEQLRTAVSRVAALGGGLLLYLDQEGRGIGLANKLRAYTVQDTGLDTVDADRHLGFHADERNYAVAAALLEVLGIARIQLLTNNPDKIAGLREHGIDVAGRLPLVGSSNMHNERYLKAKRERAGHIADEVDGLDLGAAVLGREPNGS